MIIVKLQGGLGNQMFQYAFGRAAAKKLETDLKFDNSFFDNIPEGVTPRKYGLDVFNLEISFATKEEIKKAKGSGFIWLFYKILRKLGLFYYPKYYYAEKNNNVFENNVFNKKNKTRYFDGYWQFAEYFDDIREELLNDFTLKNLDLGSLNFFRKEIEDKNFQSVSLHVRRGDTVGQKQDKPISYYNEAMSVVKERLKNPKFFIFSDDLDWCRRNFSDDNNIVFVSEGKDYQDVYLMSLCENNVITNSTFSWIGAWLNKNDNKIIIMPANWLNGSKFGEWIKV